MHEWHVILGAGFAVGLMIGFLVGAGFTLAVRR